MKTLPNQPAFELIRQLLAEGRDVSIRVEGQSMLPFFRSGERIRIRSLHSGDLQPGQVVLGQTASGHFVIHRILQVTEQSVLLQGDGNLRNREMIPCERICGIVPCSRVHRLLARIWRGLGPLRRYPLWLLRHLARP